MSPQNRYTCDEKLTLAHHNYEQGMHSYAFFKIHNNATSQDLVQDTFIKTWEYLVNGGKVGLMKAFLYHILNYLIIDEYRKRKVQSLDVLIQKGFEPHVDTTKKDMDVFDGGIALLLIQNLPTKYKK